VPARRRLTPSHRVSPPDAKKSARRAKTSARGYGSRHQKLRKAWEQKVAAGLVECGRCKVTIRPGEPWDLGHDDHDRRRYTGPEHRRCNRATSGRGTIHSQEW
jgi:hypothetical protein